MNTFGRFADSKVLKLVASSLFILVIYAVGRLYGFYAGQTYSTAFISYGFMLAKFTVFISVD